MKEEMPAVEKAGVDMMGWLQLSECGWRVEGGRKEGGVLVVVFGLL